MAAASARFPTVADGLLLPAPLAAGRRLGEGPPRAGDGGPGARRARLLALRRHHRQPDRQDGRSKRGFKGYDAGKKIHGRKRHILTDTDGRLLAVEVHAADIQDRDGAKGVLKRTRRSYPFVETVFAPLGDAMHRLPGNGRRLCRAPRRMGEGQGQRHAGDRQAHALDERLRRHRPSVGRRAHIRLDHEVPPPRAGLRAASGRRRNPHHHRRSRNPPQAMGMTLLKHALTQMNMRCRAAGSWTSPASQWRAASSIWPPYWTGSRAGCCPGGYRSRWRPISASKPSRKRWPATASQRFSTPITLSWFAGKPLPGNGTASSPRPNSSRCWRAGRSRSACLSVIASNHLPVTDGKGAWRDNVFVERLWRTIKYEEVYLRAYASVSEARASIRRYLGFYNGRRPHSSLDGKTPDQAYFNAQTPEAAAA